jgi:hypothetical protein
MEPEMDPKLESLLHRELKQLPPLKAPSSLAPGVMAILAARSRVPWWQRAWWDWPVAAKAAFVVMAIMVAGAFGGGSAFLGTGVSEYSADVVGRLDFSDSILGNFTPLLYAFHRLWEELAQPFLLYGAIAAGAVYLMFIGVGTACFRIALKRI